MQRKQNESELGTMFRRYGFHARKSRDRGYVSCPTCRTPVKVCPHCHKDMLLNKAETLPDFIVSWNYAFIEGKGATDRWPWEQSITPTQYRVMEKACNENIPAYLFLEIGEGRAPQGRSAFLIPWKTWLIIEEGLRATGHKSIVFERGPRSKNPSAEDLFYDYKLLWREGGWLIPPGHWFWHAHPEAVIIAAAHTDRDAYYVTRK